jgi:hypothetical protein
VIKPLSGDIFDRTACDLDGASVVQPAFKGGRKIECHLRNRAIFVENWRVRVGVFCQARPKLGASCIPLSHNKAAILLSGAV